jgi:hypothetical protein
MDRPGTFTISRQLAPSGGDLVALNSRKAELSSALAPGDRNDMARSIGQMFLAYQQMKLGPDETRATIAVYVSQVQEFPSWAVSAGCQKIIQRPIPFPPSAGELRAAVAAEVRRTHDEQALLLRVLTAEKIDAKAPADAETMRKKFEALKSEFSQETKGSKWELTKAEAEGWLERTKDRPKPAMNLSGAALAALSRKRENAA